LSFFSRLLGLESPARCGGEKLYLNILAQSRQRTFYRDGGFADNYEGRIEVLTLHMSIFLAHLRNLGENGRGLAQGLFDSMVDDFDIALREESLTDTGVSKRIKPIVRLFYTRAQTYDRASGQVEELNAVISAAPESQVSDGFAQSAAAYHIELTNYVKGLTLGRIANLDFSYPALR